MLRSLSPPDGIALLSVFFASAPIAHLASNQSVHLLLFKLGIPFSDKTCNATMDMYIKCGKMGTPHRAFDEMLVLNVISWTVILSGAVKLEGIESGR